MAPRRESAPRRPEARSPRGPQPRPARSGATKRRAAVRLLAAGLGVAAGVGLLGLVWPPADRSLQDDAPTTAAALADPPSRPITVLLIGSDADRRGAVRNGAAPPGPANSDALLLVRIDPKGGLQVLNLPIELAVSLPGDKKPVALGSLYRRGGPALVADAAAELVGLPKGQPDRYLVLPRAGLRELVDGLGRVELAPDRTMRYRDKAQNLTIDIQGGLQLLDGRQLEQVLRYRDGERGEAGRRDRQQTAIESVLQQMGQSQQLLRLPELVGRLQNQVDTNLTQSEALSLLAASLQPGQKPRFRSLPLSATADAKQPLRELAPEAADRPWPEG